MKKLFLSFGLFSFSQLLLAHPNGLYKIDNNTDATVAIEYLKRCPSIPGAMSGSLRALDFSASAELEPYNFESGYYVEIHDSIGEKYVKTDSDCIQDARGTAIRASRKSFGGFSLIRVSQL